VLIVGPLGQPFNEPEGKSALLVGGGTGVAPLAFFAERMAGRLTMEAIVGAPSQEYVFGRERFLRAGAELRVATEDGSDGEKGLPTEMLSRMLGESGGGVSRRDAKRETGNAFAVLACGPLAMLAEVASICREAGAECQVSLENQLGCGLGACYGCVVPILAEDGSSGWGRVCTDGPVFPAERIDWKRLPPELTAD
jgi:dihydroorotate dehydrogenase electron transfer subunit